MVIHYPLSTHVDISGLVNSSVDESTKLLGREPPGEIVDWKGEDIPVNHTINYAD
jgi:hypothetical protein